MGGPNGPNDGNCNSGGSIIGCESQTLGEDAAIAGTPYTLRYASDRVPGRRSEMSLDIPLTPDTPPARAGAGRARHRGRGPDDPPRVRAQRERADTFIWDGKDAYGRLVNGRQPADGQALLRLPDRLPRAGEFQTVVRGARRRAR